MSIKVAIFTDTFSPEINGVANTLEKLCDYFQRNDTEYRIIAPDYGTPAQEKDAHIDRIFGFKPPINPQSRLAFPMSRDVNALMKEFQPDVIHVTDALGIGYAGLKYARRHQTPLVMSYHTNFDDYLKYHNLEHFNDLVARYTKWFYSFADLTLCPSQQTMEDLKARGFERMGIWSRGIDARRFNPFYRTSRLREELGLGERLIFLYVGRVSAEKSLDLLVDAARKVQEQYGDKAAFVITGDGSYIPQMKSEGLDNLYFTGFRQGRELSEIYASADCFVCPSATETFGNVMLEAMAAGLPVICADHGGQLDFARDGHNALYFARDDANSLTQTLVRVLSAPAMLRPLAQCARDTALARDWDSIFDTLVENYHQVYNAHHMRVSVANGAG